MSSRRRHTRFDCDWSSDVCSSDLRYTVQAGDAELAELVPRIPASASKDYGTPFYDTFKRYDGDFYKIDPLLFSPAEVWLTSVESGKTHHAGHLNPDVLHASLLET